MTEYKANQYEDLVAFGDEIMALDGKAVRWFLAGIQNAGLMTWHPDNQKEIDEALKDFEDVHNLVVDSEDLTVGVFLLMEEADVEDLTNQAIAWIVEGNDQTPNSDAAGGWNQNELTLATGILEYAKTLND